MGFQKSFVFGLLLFAVVVTCGADEELDKNSSRFKDVIVDATSNNLPIMHVLKGASIRAQVDFENYPTGSRDIDSLDMLVDAKQTFFGTLQSGKPWHVQIAAPRSDTKATVQGYDGRFYKVWYVGEVKGRASSVKDVITLNPTLKYAILPL